MSNKSTLSPIGSSPQRFLRLFHGMSILSSIIIITVACYIIFDHSNKNMLHEAEYIATKISKSLAEEEIDTIRTVNQNGRWTLDIKPADIVHLDLRLRMFLQPFDILKIKIYNSEKTIIFCTDETLIGKNDPNNTRLQSALGGMTASVFKEKQTILDLFEEQRLDVDVVESYIPIFDKDKKNVAGVFEIYVDISKAKLNFTGDIMIAIGYLIAALVFVNGLHYLLIRKETEQLKSTQHLLKTMAITDPLTGMHNRRYVINRLEEEFSKMNRQQEEVFGYGIGCIMIDVDDFKQVNDQYGHFAGDEVLVEIAHRITAAVRQYDIPGRLGGEEFIVVLPDVLQAEVIPVAERIQAHINSEPFPVDGTTKFISVSIGVAWSGEKDCASGMAQILKLSDDRMYSAKNKGKNTIVDMTS